MHPSECTRAKTATWPPSHRRPPDPIRGLAGAVADILIDRPGGPPGARGAGGGGIGPPPGGGGGPGGGFGGV
ncbi:hypothetical protein E2F47_24115, partial [Mycobacterium eburneum]